MEKKERLTLFLCQAKGEHSRLEPQELCPCLTPGECVCVRTLVHTRTCTPTHTQLHLTLCNPMDSSSRGSSVHGILQTRILEWVAIPFSGHLPDPGIKPQSPALQETLYCLSHLGSQQV